MPALPHLGSRRAERRTLVLGPGITLQGSVADAERLVIEGRLDSPMLRATELLIVQAGTVKGTAEVETAEIAGSFEGTITSRGSLILRATGIVTGTLRCRRLSVEEGGQITGRVEMLSETAEAVEVLEPVPPPPTWPRPDLSLVLLEGGVQQLPVMEH